MVLGVLGLFGIQSVPQRFKGKSWTGTYVRGMALSELLMGMLLVAVAVAPSLVLGTAVTKKCNEFLKNGVE